ncbi:MAG: phage terminase small subunit P27 family [Paracoccaceae bacterium]
MAVRGRKPVPSAIKLIQGNPGRRPVKKEQSRTAALPPSPPSALKGDALREWKRVTKALGPLYMLSQLDRAVLAAYCSAYGRWKSATDALTAAAKHSPYCGLLIETTNGNLVQNPIVGIQRRAADDMVKFGTEFGLTPSARSRLGLQVPAGEPNPYDDF